MVQSGADWPLGAPGCFPAWWLIWPAALCFFYFYYYYYYIFIFCLPDVPKWSFPIVAFPNKSIINHKYQRIVRAAEKIVGVSLPSLQDIYSTRLTRKALCIAGDPTHPAHSFFSLLPSGRRLRSLQARTNRLKDSFIHQAVRKLNSLPSLPPLPSLTPCTTELWPSDWTLIFFTRPYLYICNSCILCMYVCIYMYIYIYMYVCMYVYICIYIYMYVCMYVYIYIWFVLICIFTFYC